MCFGRGENKRNYSSDEKENGCIPDVTIGIIDVLRDKKTIIGEGMCVKTCVVCGMQLPDEAMVCNRCGFPMHQRAFLSEAHYRAWMREVIEPCRIDWHRRDIEQQRKQLKEQQRQIEEQRRKQLKEQQRQIEEQQRKQLKELQRQIEEQRRKLDEHQRKQQRKFMMVFMTIVN